MSTRFTRRESSFAEMERLARMAADQLKTLLNQPEPLSPGESLTLSVHQNTFRVKAKVLDPVEVAEEKVRTLSAQVEQARREGADAQALRLLESLKEGAENNLLSCRNASGLREIPLSVSCIRLPSVNFDHRAGRAFQQAEQSGEDSLERGIHRVYERVFSVYGG